MWTRIHQRFLFTTAFCACMRRFQATFAKKRQNPYQPCRMRFGKGLEQFKMAFRALQKTYKNSGKPSGVPGRYACSAFIAAGIFRRSADSPEQAPGSSEGMRAMRSWLPGSSEGMRVARSWLPGSSDRSCNFFRACRALRRVFLRLFGKNNGPITFVKPPQKEENMLIGVSWK